VKPTLELLTATPDAEQQIEVAGRVAYGSEPNPDKTAQWIKARLDGWEHDVLEHASATFRITCSRVAAQQLTRHRIAAYTMQSQRFRETPAEDMDLLPPECKPEDAEEWLADYRAAFAVFRKWRARGYHKQAARYHLPLGSATVLVATWNFRQIRHIIYMRLPNKAEPEVRELAAQLLAICIEHWPAVFSDMTSGAEG
jgi:thymidylate synthase (FAD)